MTSETLQGREGLLGEAIAAIGRKLLPATLPAAWR